MIEIFHRTFYILFFIISLTSALHSQDYGAILYSTKNGFPQNNITQLMFDKKDRLWIGTQGGFSVFDGQKIYSISHQEMSPRIHQIFKNKRNQIFIFDTYFNIFQNNGSNLKINKINNNKENAFNWVLDSIECNKFEKMGNLNDVIYFYTHHLGYKNFKVFAKNQSQHFIKYSKYFSNLKTYFLTDSVLIGLTKEHVWIKYIDDQKQYLIHSELPNNFNPRELLFNTDKSTYWLNNKNIFEIKLVENHLKSIPVANNIPLDISSKQINCGTYNNKSGYFYFGSEKNGLYEIRPLYFKTIQHKSETKNVNELSSSYAYYSQAEIGHNSIFINNYGIIRNKSRVLVQESATPFSRSVNFVDSQKRLWYNDGQSMIIQKGNKKYKILISPLSHPALSMVENTPNNYLILNPNSIIICDTVTEIGRLKLEKLKGGNYEIGQYLHYNKVTQTLFLLTNKKIYTVNLNTESFEPIHNLQDADYRIMSTLKDKSKFIGTYGQGYLIFDGKKWTQMPLDKKGYLKFAHAALLDVRGHVWISTNNGLFRTRLQDMIDYTQGKTKDIFYYYYDKSSGFLTNEFNGGCQSPAIKLRDGRFSYSSMDGLVQFDPLKVPTSFPLHQPNIIDLKLNNQSQDSVPTSLVITQDIKDIKLEVSTTFYGHPNNLQIQYKIPGYVDRWTDLTDQRYINLQNATYGDYTIEIRQRIGFGSHDFEYISYPLVVLPYFYQTWWFIAILSVIGLSLAYIFSRWYSRYMIQKNKELEMLILERNKEVLQTNEVLQEQVKQNDLFQSIFVHDIKSPIRFITSNTALLKTHWNHLDTTIKQDQISHIHDAATKIDHFIEETLLWIKIRNGELQLETNDFQALAMIQECIDFHKESDKIIRGDIQILADVHQDLYLTQDERLLATIIRNLISNSIKYTAHGKIIVYFLSKPNGSFTIGCKDTGKGMPKSLVEKLLSDHYRGNDIRDDSFKMGYVIIKEIVRLISGQLHIESEENHGTHVWVEI